MSSLDAFRQEISDWIDDNAPESLLGAFTHSFGGEWGGRKCEPAPDRKRWLEVMGERGYTAPMWPKAYGGAALSKAENKVLQQELRRRKLPPALVGFGLVMIGPTLLDWGNEEQKQEHLPKIARGQIRWCQGYSEPDAGSDLASLRTRAERDGDHFVVTGQKVWTSYADESDWIFCLVRTNADVRKQAGITFLLIDMDDPGVTTRPIGLISGSSPFCEVFFDEVRVPVENVVGQIDGGWSVAKALLAYERSMVGDAFGATAVGTSDGTVGIARRALGEVDGRLADPILRDRVAQLEIEAKAFGLTVQRTRDGIKAGQKPGPESSILKIAGTEINQQRQSLRVSITGPQALGWDGPGFSDSELQLTRDWLRSRGNTIEGGTSEIQLNIIAKRVLGLPD